MPTADGRFKGIAVPRLWPGHRDYEPPPTARCLGCTDERPCYEVGCDYCYFKLTRH